MAKYFFQNAGINFELDIFIMENDLSFQCKTNINNNIYNLKLSLKNLHNKDEFFQRCNSLNEAFQLIVITFNDNKAYIKEINNSGIILGIKDKNNKDILLVLKPDWNNNMNNNWNGNSFYINNNNRDNIGGHGINDSNNNNINSNNSFINIINNSINNNNNNSINNNNNNSININNININFSNNINNIIDNSNINNNNINNNINNNGINENDSYINVKIFQNNNNNLNQIKPLAGLLKLCLVKNLSDILSFIDNIDGKLPENLKQIFQTFKNNIYLTGDENIKLMINENKIINLLTYSQYINSKINSDSINILINQFLNTEQKEYILNYWKGISNYETYNSYFESQFFNDLKKCKFDYSLVSINILESENIKEYEKNVNKIPNINIKILYQKSKISPITGITNEILKYSKKTSYGKGFYFTDLIDYIPIYLDLDKNDLNFGKIIPVNSTFSFIASEINYDENKYKEIEDINISIKELNNIEYQDKIVEPNGLRLIKIENNKNTFLFNNSKDNKNLQKKKILGNEYVISSKNQILPIYTLTLKRNEYCILWRDPNFAKKNPYTKYLNQLKQLCMEKANMNIYYESSTEKALKFLVKRKYDKVILISSIGKDLSGKRFIEIARKIFGFDVIVLFFSNNTSHFGWLKNFNNCLYTNNYTICEEYITNYNESGLKELKKKVEQFYKIQLKQFSFDFILFPNFKNEGDYSSLDFNSYYIRHVNIKNGDNYLSMTKNGIVKVDKEKCVWDITIYDNEITMFSNGYYLDINKNEQKKENVIGFQYMIRWNFNKINEYYYFINLEKMNNNILSITGDEVKVNKESAGNDEMFLLIDVLEEEEE